MTTIDNNQSGAYNYDIQGPHIVLQAIFVFPQKLRQYSFRSYMSFMCLNLTLGAIKTVVTEISINSLGFTKRLRHFLILIYFQSLSNRTVYYQKIVTYLTTLVID